MCTRCKLDKPPSKTNRHLCDDCVKAENNRVSHFRRHNFNWMEVSKEADLDLWERQPAETDHEWSVWLRYRDAYPGKRPTYRGVAEEMGTTVNAVRKIGGRWSFNVRLQAWAKYVDELTMLQRQEEIIGMNKQHIDMAKAINSKLEQAIALLDPATMAPNEIKNLYQIATETERKARLDQPIKQIQLVDEDNPELRNVSVESTDVKEILGILEQAGALKNSGVRQTVTEVVIKGD